MLLSTLTYLGMKDIEDGVPYDVLSLFRFVV